MMAVYFIRAIGSDFDVADEGVEYADAAGARRAAVRAAIELAAEEINDSQRSSIIEARVEDKGEAIARYVIALSVEPLEVP